MKTTTLAIGAENMPAFIETINNMISMNIILKEDLGANTQTCFI